MKNELTAKRLQLALSRSNMRPQDLADSSGVSKSSISQYINGSHSPSNISAAKIGKVLKVNPLWLMGFDVSDVSVSPSQYSTNTSAPVTIPVLGRVAAGIPLTAAEYIIDTEEIPQAMAADGEYFGLQVKGDSMEPRIKNGDVVIVRKQSDADDGDLVIALINGDDAVVKRLKKYKDGIGLISSNPTYDPLYFSNEEIESKPVEIIGKVKELRAKF